jgi:hypothetical protein
MIENEKKRLKIIKKRKEKTKENSKRKVNIKKDVALEPKRGEKTTKGYILRQCEEPDLDC